MIRNWTLGRKLAAGFGLAGVTLLVIAAVSYRTTYDLIENNMLVTRTYEIQTALGDLLSELKDAETGQRGYIIVGNDSYLEPYQDALVQLKRTLDRVQKLTAANPAQAQRLVSLSPLIAAKLAELAQVIDLRKAQGLNAAVERVATGTGKTLMDQIRSLVGDADRDEDALLRRRSEEAKSSAQWAQAITLWGGLGGGLAVSAIGWFIIHSLSKQIGTAVGHVQSSSTELQAAANQQATGAKEQATAMTEITTTISELLTTSRQIAQSAQRVAQIASETTDAAQAGHGTVDIAHESVATIRRQVDQIVVHMLELEKKSQEIGSVLDIVSELAEQTNILAINATIEAAGAGEAGKRFSVVADEIRKLADRVGGSTKEIRTLIDDVRSAVNTTVMATETGSKAVDTGSRLFGDVASGLKQISSLVTTTTEAAREIELSTKQQSSAVEQVNMAIANVAQASKETEASSGQILMTASQLASLSKDLLRIIRPQTVTP